MTYKQIEASREARLWITQVIVPVLGLATAVVVSVPEVRETVTTKAKGFAEKVKNRLRK